LSTYSETKRAELSFGDVCSAEFLYDVHVRGDARALTRQETSAAFAKKMWQLDQPVSYFVALGPNDDNYVLARGWPRTAVLLSDDCLIASALGRDGREPDGRLLFAPVVAASAEDLANLDELPTYGRFPLEGDALQAEHAVVELRRCFMADARDVAAAGADLSIRSLADATCEGLAIRWAAYALRRGKFVVEDNLEKFAEILLDAGVSADEAKSFGSAVATVAAAAWRYEGRGIEDAGIAFDQKGAPLPVVEQLEAELGVLVEAVQAALESVQQVRAQLA
jgi:hypothetical protein